MCLPLYGWDILPLLLLFSQRFNIIFDFFFIKKLLKFFLLFIYIWEREREGERERSMSGGGAERRRHRIWSRLLALSCQHRIWCKAQIHKQRDHDLSQSQMLNWLSHSSTPDFSFFKGLSIYFERDSIGMSLCMWAAEGQRERRERIQDPHSQHRARCRAQSHELWDHDQSRNQESDTLLTELPTHLFMIFLKLTSFENSLETSHRVLESTILTWAIWAH